MRQLLLLAIVAVICVIALTTRPRVGIYGYVWYSLMRPDVLSYVAYSNYFSTALAVATILGSLRCLAPGLSPFFRSKLVLALLLFITLAGLSTAAAVDSSLALFAYWGFLRMMLVLLLIPILFQTPEQFRTLFFVAAGSIGFLGLKYGVFGVIHGGAKFTDGLINDNNFLALHLAVGVPLCWYAASMVKSKIIRMGLYGIVFFTISAVVMTYSRGGAIALGVGLLLIALRSKHKVILVAFLAILSLPAIYLAGDAYMNRMSTVADPLNESSAASRVYLAKIGLRMWKDYPVLGVGFGRTNQQKLMPQYFPEFVEDESYGVKVLHNTYIQMLVDCGLLGFLVYVAILFGGIISMRSCARRTPRPLNAMPGGLLNALIIYAVGSTFISAVPSFDAFFTLIMMAAGWQALQSATQLQPAASTAVNNTTIFPRAQEAMTPRTSLS